MKQPHSNKAHILGSDGEQMAAQYLSDIGYTIVERNYRAGKNEIDIIALDGDEMVIVEVKTRTSEALVDAEEAVNHRKRQALIHAADQYMTSHERTEQVRFDIIAIVAHQPQPELRHLKNAFNIMCH